MKYLFLLLFTTIVCMSASAQFVAKLEVKEPIAGLCNDKKVYALLSFLKGQEEAVCPVSKDSILKRLNTEVSFLKDNTDYNDKGMIGIIINCKHEVVQCKMDNKTKNADLDKQIEAVFNSLGEWKVGKLNGRAVDTSRLFSFKIKNGLFVFD